MEKNVIGLGDLVKDGSKFGRRVNLIKDIVVGSCMKQMEDSSTYVISVGVGIVQGVRLNDFKRGARSALAVYAVMVGTNVVHNIVRNVNGIKNA